MIPLCFYDMAPENFKDTDICSIKKLTEKYEALFTAKLDRNDKRNLANFLHHFNDELRIWYLQLKIKPDTWIKMRNQIKKLVNEKAIINIIKNKIKDEEDTFTWFERNLGILEGSWLSLEISHTLLLDAANDFESYFKIAK